MGSLPSFGHGIDIERLAHIGEYAGLVALLYRALAHPEQRNTEAVEQGRVTQGKSAHNPKLTHAPQHLCISTQKAAVRRQRTVVGSSAVAFALALTYAVLDELHQELAPGRGFELADIGYDLTGIIAALGLIWLRERGKASRREGEQRTLRSCPRG